MLSSLSGTDLRCRRTQTSLRGRLVWVLPPARPATPRRLCNFEAPSGKQVEIEAKSQDLEGWQKTRRGAVCRVRNVPLDKKIAVQMMQQQGASQ